MNIEFLGPFCIQNQQGLSSLFDVPISNKYGIYLWTIPQDSFEYVYYVGETGRSFRTRMIEHIKEHLSGFYHLYDPEKFQHGEKALLWPGYYDRINRKNIKEIINNYINNSTIAINLLNLYRFYFADFNSIDRIRKRIEAAIAHHLYNQKGIIGDFQDKGIRYYERKNEEDPIILLIHAPNHIRGLPLEIII